MPWLAGAMPLVASAAVAAAGGVEACDAAASAVASAAAAQGLRASIHCRLAETAQAAAGRADWFVSESLGRVAPGAMRVVLAPASEGRLPLRVAVPVQVELSSDAWVARRDIRRGEPLVADDLVLAPYTWPAGSRPETAAATPPLGRAEKLLRAGVAVRASDVLSSGTLAAGDTVQAALHANGISLQLPAVLLASARVGDRVRVQLKDRRVVLEGRLSGNSFVEIEP